MKINLRTSLRCIFLGAAILAVHSASAFYDPNVGRWLTRDPLGEPGFESARTGGGAGDMDGADVYAFVGNNSVNQIDPLGLIKFDGCDEIQKRAIADGFAAYCPKISTSRFKCCLDHINIPARLKHMCDNLDDLTVKCESKDSGVCKGACAWSLPGGKTIHMCPEQWSNPGCGAPGCTLLHEMTHMVGHGFEKWPQKVEQCLGCKK